MERNTTKNKNVNNLKNGIGCSSWWLRSPGGNFDGYVSLVYPDGRISSENANKNKVGCRPVIRLDLSLLPLQ